MGWRLQSPPFAETRILYLAVSNLTLERDDSPMSLRIRSGLAMDQEFAAIERAANSLAG